MKYNKLENNNSGIKWKRYSIEKVVPNEEGSIVEFIFPEITDWEKCSISISGCGSATFPIYYEEIKIDKETNTISVKAYAATLICEVCQFEGNVKIQKDFSKNIQEGRYQTNIIKLAEEVNPLNCLLLYGLLTVNQAHQVTTLSGGFINLDKDKISIKNDAFSSTAYIYLTWNVVEFLD